MLVHGSQALHGAYLLVPLVDRDEHRVCDAHHGDDEGHEHEPVLVGLDAHPRSSCKRVGPVEGVGENEGGEEGDPQGDRRDVYGGAVQAASDVFVSQPERILEGEIDPLFLTVYAHNLNSIDPRGIKTFRIVLKIFLPSGS